MPEFGFVTYLDDSLAIVCVLGVDDDLQLHALSLHDSFESCRTNVRRNRRYGKIKAPTFEVDPQVVGVEDLEFADYDVLRSVTSVSNLV
jgi:hypothetical protein